MDDNVRGARMANDVGQRFLENPEERGRQIGREHRFVEVGMNVTFDSSAGLKFVCLPLERGDQPEMIQNSRTKFGGNAADRLDGGIDM